MLSLALVTAGCASPPDNIECNVARDASGRAIVTTDMPEGPAIYLAAKANTLAAQLAKDPGLAGFRGGVARRFSGTASYSFAIELNHLRSLVARQKALELALANEGDTLIGTTEKWQCATFADSVASLDPGQSPDRLVENLKTIRDRFDEVPRSVHVEKEEAK